jgi:glycerol-3-phosphate dehydrogenase
VSIARERIGNLSALTLLAPGDGRVMFVLPAGDFAIVGTTDTYESVAPDQVRATAADVEYLLAAANHFFPAARLGREDVVAAWAGLRPLAPRGDARGDDPGSASREHEVVERVDGLVSVTGGKLTTYRVMARDAVDAAQRSAGQPAGRARTAHEPLAGGRIAHIEDEIAAAAAASGDGAVGTRLVHAHGDAWREVWALAQSDPSLAARVEATRPYLIAELRHAVTRELAMTLGDLLIRRTPLAFETRDHGRAAARRVAPQVARWLGWSEIEMRAAIAEYDAETARIFRVEERGAG